MSRRGKIIMLITAILLYGYLLYLIISSINGIRALYAAKHMFGDNFPRMQLLVFSQFSCPIFCLFIVAAGINIILSHYDNTQNDLQKRKNIYLIFPVILMLCVLLSAFYIIRYKNVTRTVFVPISVFVADLCSLAIFLIEFLTAKRKKSYNES